MKVFDINNLIDEARLSGDHLIHLPAAQIFLTEPLQVIDFPLKMIGQGKNNTILIRSYTSEEPVIIARRGDLILRDLTIVAGNKTSGGAAIELRGEGNDSADGSVLDNVYITGWGGTWDTGILLDGSKRHLGLRTIYINNCDVFACLDFGILAKKVKGLYCNTNVYPAGGVADNIYMDDCDNCLIHTYHLETLDTNNSRNIKLVSAYNESFWSKLWGIFK